MSRSASPDSDPEVPSRIQYHRTPSPVHKVVYTDDLEDDIVSPQKKRRVYRERGTNRQARQKPLRVENTDNGTAHDSGQDSDYGGPDDLRVDNITLEVNGRLDSQVDRDSSYQAFLNSLDWDDTMFTPVSDTNRVFVVHGWSDVKLEASMSRYHLSRTRAGTGASIMCECPSWRMDSPCVHERYLLEHGDTEYPIGLISDNDGHPCLLSRTETAVDDTYLNVFSIKSPNAKFQTIKARALVEHTGPDTGEGRWSCSKDARAVSCIHIKEARNYLRRLLTGDVNAEDEAANGSLLYDPTMHGSHKSSRAAPPAVSHLLRPPPTWARISSDAFELEVPIPTAAPDLIKLDRHSTCCCKTNRTTFSPEREVTVKSCMVYTLTGAWECTIETQRCPACSYRLIGPDCRDLGIFNFNNRALYTHELLDDYTSAFTSSETPFSAWVLNTSRRYVARQSREFVKEKNFIAVYFSYMALVKLEGDMRCTVCGPSPKVTIWDGVTLAFNRRHLMTTLRPPTTVTDSSPIKDQVKPLPNLQCIPDKSLRKDIRHILDGPTLEVYDPHDLAAPPIDPSASEESRLAAEKRHASKIEQGRAMLARLEKIPGTVSSLQDIDEHLGALFQRELGLHAIASGRQPQKMYIRLFRQIAAEENALQLVNNTAHHALMQFLESPTLVTASNLVLIPALHAVVHLEWSSHGQLTDETSGLCRWLFKRVYAVMKALRKYGPPKKEDEVILDLPWQETGSCYAMPPVRTRPVYPSFPNDSGRDNNKKELRGEGCNKFYAQYGESRLTGGIMVVWCTHSISYGFHCIPAAEGRNDVFSAIYTHWVMAPNTVVYDYACALQPYCMAREPEFFANTLFVIDSFHSGGHTKCGQAAFLDTYCVTNPLLLAVNSSAAECGNGGILRIRKSVIYMSQARAIMYTKIFISIWNRARIQAQERRI